MTGKRAVELSGALKATEKRYIDLLKIEKLRKNNPTIKYGEIAKQLGFSYSKVANAFGDNQFKDIPAEIRSKYDN